MLSNLQLNKLKSRKKIGTEVTLKISLNAVRDSSDNNNFPHKLLLTNTQVSRLLKAFANGLSAKTKLSKTQLHKIRPLGGFLDSLLGPLLKTGLSLIGYVLKLLAKGILIPLGLTAAASATVAAIHKKMFGSDVTTLIISNEEMNDIVKIAKSLEEFGWQIKGIIETIKRSKKSKKRISQYNVRNIRC